MTDILREVEDDLRRERYARLWKDYGIYALGLAALLIATVGGWQVWTHNEQEKRVETANAYLTAQKISDPAEGAKAFAALAGQAPKGYAVLARMQEANALLSAGKREDALKLYTELMGGSDPLLAQVARLRLAFAQADTLDKAKMQSLLAPLNAPNNTFRFMAQELLAYVDYRQGNSKGAQESYSRLAKDPQTPQGTKLRSAAMAEFLAAGGMTNIGSVPPPPQAQLSEALSPDVPTPELLTSPATSEPAKAP